MELWAFLFVKRKEKLIADCSIWETLTFVIRARLCIVRRETRLILLSLLGPLLGRKKLHVDKSKPSQEWLQVENQPRFFSFLKYSSEFLHHLWKCSTGATQYSVNIKWKVSNIHIGSIQFYFVYILVMQRFRVVYIEDNTWFRGDMKFIFECSNR